MKYRKKPVVIDAYHWTDNKFNDAPHWFFEAIGEGKISTYFKKYVFKEKKDVMVIETFEGVMTASLGDYIIRGVKGELYACKPDIFEMTYEPVAE
ncbi:MAG: hypothetical protein Q4D42_13200 [Eubacteriales bacterium]|nr:hypothetical protein [Eubacteriales bacterium]